MHAAGAIIAVKTILFPTDFSEESAQAIGYARTLAHAYQAKVHVANVVDVFPYSLSDTAEAGEKKAELLRRSETRLKDFMLTHRLDPRHFTPAVLTGKYLQPLRILSERRKSTSSFWAVVAMPACNGCFKVPRRKKSSAPRAVQF